MSKSHNTPFLGQRFTGRPICVVVRNAVRLIPTHSVVGT